MVGEHYPRDLRSLLRSRPGRGLVLPGPHLGNIRYTPSVQIPRRASLEINPQRLLSGVAVPLARVQAMLEQRRPGPHGEPLRVARPRRRCDGLAWGLIGLGLRAV